jgi:hypothetical protein
VEWATEALDGEAGGLVDEGEGRFFLLIFHECAEALVFKPVLVLDAGVSRGEDSVAVADGEA